MTLSSGVHPVDEVLPPQQMATYGLQHVLVLYAGAVAVPLILGSALGLTQAQVVTLINANLLTSGIATLIQTLGFWKFGARLPLVQACSFIALAPMIMIGKEYGLPHVFGAVIAGGAVTMLLAPVISRLLRFFPPVVIGSLITVIGISLMPAAAIWLGGGNPDAADFGSAPNLLLGLATIGVTLFVYARFGGFVGNLSVLLGLVAGTAIAAAFGLTDFAQVGHAAWFELSAPFASGCRRSASCPRSS
nr:solute carrier family 23 protein [Variovorax sp. E3]